MRQAAMFQTSDSILQHHLQLRSVILGNPLKKSLNYIIAQICQSGSQNATEFKAD